MPSIFIWKSDVPNNSKKQIRYYSGSNWILEENNSLSNSYMILDQFVIPGFNDSVITYNVKLMPRDWIGSDLLEISYIPYEVIKSDNYGTLDRIGNWMRFTSKYDINFDTESLEKELIQIQKWMFDSETTPSLITQEFIQDNFEKFILKYNISLINLNNYKINY